MDKVSALAIPILFCAAVFTGCVGIGDPGPGNASSLHITKEPVLLALSPEDVPNGFSLAESRAKNATEVSELARDLGWEDGYVVRFEKPEGLSSEPTVITQSVAMYPAERMPQIVRYVTDNRRSQQGYVVTDLPDPGLGSSGNAVVVFKQVQNEGSVDGAFPIGPPDSLISAGRSGGTTGQQLEYYEIVFTNGRVFEALRMSGPSARYESLHALAEKAYRKT